jgi:hypothetical protein
LTALTASRQPTSSVVIADFRNKICQKQTLAVSPKVRTPIALRVVANAIHLGDLKTLPWQRFALLENALRTNKTT